MDEYPYKIVGWKIWYCNETLEEFMFTNKDGTWAEAPDQNVQVVMAYADKHDGQGRACRMIFRAVDYYWYNGKVFDSGDVLTEATGPVKYGKEILFSKYEEIVNHAMEDYEI